MTPAHIKSLAVHVPRYRLRADTAATFWGERHTPGARAVANWDEDSVTMAADAGRRCLARTASSTNVHSLILASTTFPYAEKQSAAMVAEALDLPQNVETLDVASSIRAGSQALRLGADRVHATGRPVLVLAADTRAATPETGEERTWGDAAAAILLDSSGPVQLRWVTNRYETWLSHWRLAAERYGHAADSRFVSGMTEELLAGMLQDAFKTATDFGERPQHVAIATENPRAVKGAAVAAAVPEGTRFHGPDLQTEIGYCGTAAPFLSLAAALEHARAGEQMAWINSGDGADAALAVVDSDHPFDTPTSSAVEAGRDISYGRYLKVRDVVSDTQPEPFSSEIAQWRESAHTARLHGAQCSGCAGISYPPQPTCRHCGERRQMRPFAVARTGRLFTFTVEHLFPNPERELAMGVVDLDDGIRFYCPITDVSPDDLHIGMRMRLTYRRLHVGGGFVNYFWKATTAEEDYQS